MIDRALIDEICRLRWGEGYSRRKIAKVLKVGRRTVARYLREPGRQPAPRGRRSSKLDPYHSLITDLLEQDERISAVLIWARLRGQGYRGGISIVRDYLRGLRPGKRSRRAYLLVESAPGERVEADWAYFGSLEYQGDSRRLYAFTALESHSRMLYVEFTHSQTLETFARCHQHAFAFLGGVGRETWYDNLATAVAEHDGTLVRFQPRFWEFARHYSFTPRACNKGAPWEKGKTERVIGYVRKNFWPLRAFRDLADVNRQVGQWLRETANVRVHAETRQRPCDRFRPEALLALPALPPDYRDTVSVVLRKDFLVRFDGNRYAAPPRLVGRTLELKADAYNVWIYYHDRQVAAYARCWRRGQTLGIDRFREELLETRPGARLSLEQQRLVTLLGESIQDYLRGVIGAQRGLVRQVRQLLELVDSYGPEAVREAVTRTQSAGAYGADYVAYLLWQERHPRDPQPPLRLKDDRLNQLAAPPTRLEDYDQVVLTQRSSHAATDGPSSATEPDHPQPPTPARPGRGRS
jgi:transposase